MWYGTIYDILFVICYRRFSVGTGDVVLVLLLQCSTWHGGSASCLYRKHLWRQKIEEDASTIIQSSHSCFLQFRIITSYLSFVCLLARFFYVNVFVTSSVLERDCLYEIDCAHHSYHCNYHYTTLRKYTLLDSIKKFGQHLNHFNFDSTWNTKPLPIKQSFISGKDSVNQTWYNWKANVLTFPTKSHSLQSLHFGRRDDPLTIGGSQIKFDKIQHCHCSKFNSFNSPVFQRFCFDFTADGKLRCLALNW